MKRRGIIIIGASATYQSTCDASNLGGNKSIGYRMVNFTAAKPQVIRLDSWEAVALLWRS